jgi:hypothetical protein
LIHHKHSERRLAGPANPRPASPLLAQVKEFSIDYTQCEFVAPNTSFDPLDPSFYSYHTDSIPPTTTPTWQFTHDAAATNLSTQSLCRLQFSIPVDMKAPVFMYYKRAFAAVQGCLFGREADVCACCARFACYSNDSHELLPESSSVRQVDQLGSTEGERQDKLGP